LGIAIFTLGAIYYAGRTDHNTKNGFLRKWTLNPLQKIAAIPTISPLNNIVGANETGIFFTDTISSRIIRANVGFTRLDTLPITITYPGVHYSFYSMLDSSKFYTVAFNLPAIFEENINGGDYSVHRFKKPFARCVHINGNSFIVRTYDSAISDLVFKKVNTNAPESFQISKELTRRFGDGGLSTDGFLYYDQLSNLICYTYFYRNGFFCVDTNLNMVIQARTIDTFTREDVLGKRFSSGKDVSFMLSSPPDILNYKGCVQDGLLYLNSLIKSDNESPIEFANNLTIDVYSLSTGHYLHSFHVPFLVGRKPLRFRVFNNTLIVIYSSALVKYQLTISQ